MKRYTVSITKPIEAAESREDSQGAWVLWEDVQNNQRVMENEILTLQGKLKDAKHLMSLMWCRSHEWSGPQASSHFRSHIAERLKTFDVSMVFEIFMDLPKEDAQ